MTEDTGAAIESVLGELENQRKAISDLKVKSYLFIGIGILSIVGGFFLGSMALFTVIPGIGLLIPGFIFLGKGNTRFNEYSINTNNG